MELFEEEATSRMFKTVDRFPHPTPDVETRFFPVGPLGVKCRDLCGLHIEVLGKAKLQLGQGPSWVIRVRQVRRMAFATSC
jgi:hypothetical protein